MEAKVDFGRHIVRIYAFSPLAGDLFGWCEVESIRRIPRTTFWRACAELAGRDRAPCGDLRIMRASGKVSSTPPAMGIYDAVQNGGETALRQAVEVVSRVM
ncbi:hypothetical protein LTR56_014272 [Elasticomyces elasticus]|uniref:Uncharacterized protein n=1 Tax=Elasticomyces elasticus TaxID=574655 RepID=A0AAN7W805_9PEZI|nr:hypothetical protein LTR22_022482 [Elasticomyces elasticus]KAK3636316.1 hypothetical protein LTR56_014272 [Elasticomyces elasticus]KAK4930522.1 hypothetical protein LTR49_002934 [Elasticomyces elasticus]KAK4950212.1 hypothetical protein LTR10_011191 [Elasticomyces elasticus]KAK4966388.1 hypothetical protein LTR42_011551 [Elasticomyces elasticus]